MCYCKRSGVGYRTKGQTRIPQTKPEQPTRPSAEDIERLKIKRLAGLEKQVVRTLMGLRKKRLTVSERIKEMESLPHIQRLALKRQERELHEEDAEIAAKIREIQFIPKDEAGTHEIKRWLKGMKKAA